MPDLLTTAEAAERCKVGPRAFTTWAKRMGVMPVAFGRRQRWRWSDVQDGIERAVREEERAAGSACPAKVVPIRGPKGDCADRRERLRRDARSTP